MRFLISAAALAVAVAAVATASSAEPPVHECDRLAASPDDPDRAAPGVSLGAIDFEKAVAACTKAAATFPNAPRFRYQLGRAYHAAGRIETGLLHVHDAAEAGHLHAQTVLGEAFATGNGVPTDHVEALKWYMMAAENGGRIAQTRLGAIYFTGRGTEPDLARARHWYGLAAGQGDLPSQVILGFMYFNGQGGAQDSARAAKWLGKAAARGAAEAQFGLAALYLSGAGVKRDMVRSHMWMTLAAEGFPPGGKRDSALAFRKALTKAMTLEQIDEAKRMAEEWTPAGETSMR